MRSLIFLLLMGVFFAGCGKIPPADPPSYYQLTIGKKSLNLVVHDDPKLIQDEIIANLKPMWDELKDGNSDTFRIGRVYNDVGPTNTVGKLELNFKETRRSPVVRFFKNREGSNGVEQLDSDGKTFAVRRPDWAGIEALLRENDYSIERLREILQNRPTNKAPSS
jgi:hypothetical protein